MTERQIIIELESFVLTRNLSTQKLPRYFIKTKLIELRDSLHEWAHLIEKKTGEVLLGKMSIIFDVAGIILNKKPDLELIDAEFFQKNDLPLSQYDKILIYSYINWKICESEIRSKGYDLTCPYQPYIDLFKTGSSFLSCSHNRLEVCNVGIEIT